MAAFDPRLQAGIGDPQPLTPYDISGFIVVGGKSQVLAQGNIFRKQLIIENPLTASEQGIAVAENLYVNVGGLPATLTYGNFANLAPGGSIALNISLGPGGVAYIDRTQVTVNAATTGHGYNAKEYV